MKKIHGAAGRIKDKCLNQILPAIYLCIALCFFALALFLPNFIGQEKKFVSSRPSFIGSGESMTLFAPYVGPWESKKPRGINE